jgi:hypothetical protein
VKLFKFILILIFPVLLVFLIYSGFMGDDSRKFDMGKELMRIYSEEKFPESILRSDLGVAYFDALIGEANGAGNPEFLTKSAIYHLLNGNPIKCIEMLETLIIGSTGNKPPWNNISVIHEWLALAYFRAGEINNCLLNHNSSSCIYPLTPEAVHIQQQWSRQAIALYHMILLDDPGNATARWMFNLAHMTLGTYPDSVPINLYIDFSMFESDIEYPNFKDVAALSGVDMDGLYGGVIVEDFNNDGLLDIFATSGLLSDNVKLYLRKPGGGFYDATGEFMLNGITGGVHAIQADYNNDGHVDIFILRGGWQMDGGRHPNSLLRNNGDGTFTDVTKIAGLLDYAPTHTAVWADFDNDGYLDLFVGHETGSYDQVDFPDSNIITKQYPVKLFRNNGDESFTDITRKSGLSIAKWVKGAVFIDYNNNNKQDLYISCYNGKNHLFRNESKGAGHFKFTDVTELAGVSEPFFSFPVAAFDINNDGCEDLFVSGYFTSGNDLAQEYVSMEGPSYRSYTYINNCNGTFAAWASEKGPGQSILAMGMNVGDLDNDGFSDIYFGTGSGSLESLYPNVMLKNIEGSSWADVTSNSGLGHLQKSHGIAFGDLDGDGDLDIYMNIGGLYTGDRFWNALFENPGNANNWISFRLIGTQSNRSAIGAKIIVTIEDGGIWRSYYRTVHSGSSYGGSPLVQHFGLGKGGKIISVKVFWPSGTISEAELLEYNGYYSWNEDEVAPVKLLNKQIPMYLDYSLQHHHSSHHK